jgi:hypothetical protein
MSNIFASINKRDKECNQLNKNANSAFYTCRTKDKNICKHYFIDSLFQWESLICLHLFQKSIIPIVEIDSINLTITYQVKDMMSLRSFLLCNKNKARIVISEVFSMIKNFKRYKFIHGNLHIDNIFVNYNNNNKNNNLYVVDFTNSNITGSIFKNPYYKPSITTPPYYLSDSNVDYMTIYASLLEFIKSKSSGSNKDYLLDHLKKQIAEYVSVDLQLLNMCL